MGEAEKFPRGAWLADLQTTIGEYSIKERPTTSVTEMNLKLICH